MQPLRTYQHSLSVNGSPSRDRVCTLRNPFCYLKPFITTLTLPTFAIWVIFSRDYVFGNAGSNYL